MTTATFNPCPYGRTHPRTIRRHRNRRPGGRGLGYKIGNRRYGRRRARG